MTQLHVPERPPSWLMPIAVTAMATVLAQWIPLALGSAVPPLACGTTCCCGIGWAPIGVLAALLVLQRDPLLTPGQGFAVSFIASGLGSVFSALYWVFNLQSVERDEREQQLRDLLEESNELQQPAQRLTPEQIDDVVTATTDIVAYVPVVLALIYTALAGVAGLLTVALLRRRAGPPMAPPSAPPPPP